MKLSNVVFSIFIGLFFVTTAAAREPGFSKVQAVLSGMPIDVFVYRPAGCTPTGILFLFHGINRDAADYRDEGRLLGDRQCLTVMAPLFDRDRFPNWRYQRGGVVRKGRVLPASDWTVSLIPGLIDWARRLEGNPDLPCILFGHSAGGQFLSRVAAYMSPDVTRIVIANPSSYVLPSLEEAAPYGMGNMFAAADGEERLREYLAKPVTIYLGGNDTDHENLHGNAASRRLGANRLERGKTIYRLADELASAKGWPFNWKLVIAPGIDHSSKDMLVPFRAMAALGETPARLDR